MSTKTIIAWVNGDVQEIEVEDFEYVVHGPTMEERLYALENAPHPKAISSITLFAADWVGDASPYRQAVEIAGVTPYSKVDLQPSIEQLEIFHDKDLAFVTENDDGVVTVYALGDKPTNDYAIQATITEVEV